MRFLLILLIPCISLAYSATINSENDSIALVESVKEQLKELENEATNIVKQEKLQWQLKVIELWYKDHQQCSQDLSYIFNDWTVIQRRQDGSEDFDRTWSDYKEGFGDKNNEFFIGLEELHLLTANETQELLILLGDHKGNLLYAKYDNFKVSGEEDKYQLQELGKYSGTAGDSLRFHKGKKFSTFDMDNDESRRNCAQLAQGGWWFNYCITESYLNAPYVDPLLKGDSTKGMIWEAWHGLNYSLKFSQMMMRKK